MATERFQPDRWHVSVDSSVAVHYGIAIQVIHVIGSFNRSSGPGMDAFHTVETIEVSVGMEILAVGWKRGGIGRIIDF